MSFRALEGAGHGVSASPPLERELLWGAAAWAFAVLGLRKSSSLVGVCEALFSPRNHATSSVAAFLSVTRRGFIDQSIACAVAVATGVLGSLVAAAHWKPAGPIEILVGTDPNLPP